MRRKSWPTRSCLARLWYHCSGGIGTGPEVWRVALLGDEATVIGRRFKPFEQEGMSRWGANNLPNGPYLKMAYAEYEFKFKGFVSDCRIRIDFVQQRGLKNDWFNQNKKDMFMPQMLHGFRGICGWGLNDIDPKAYKIIKTKRVYIDAAPSNTIADNMAGAGDDQANNTVDSTTVPTKYCKVRIPLNQVLRQLVPSTQQDDGNEKEDQAMDDTKKPGGGNYAYDNLNPLQNIWCVISTDDENGLTDGLTQSTVRVEVLRKLCWRDPVA